MLFSLFTALRSHFLSDDAAVSSAGPCLIEPLEGRVLLSAAAFAGGGGG